MINAQLKRRFGPFLKEHAAGKEVFSFGVGGVVDYLVEVSTIDQLIRAAVLARQTGLPWLVVGTGSQVLVSDYGFPGLIITNRAGRLEAVGESAQLLADSGLTWPQLIFAAANRNLTGGESFLTLAGTIGGAIWQERTARGRAPSSLIRSVTVLLHDGSIRTVDRTELAQLRSNISVILVVRFQFIPARRDEVARRLRANEVLRRRLSDGRFWLGPIFASDFARADPTYLSTLFKRAKVAGFRRGNLVFSGQRENFVERRGKATAFEVREFLDDLTRLVSAHATSPVVCQINFLGRWDTPTPGLSAAGVVW